VVGRGVGEGSQATVGDRGVVVDYKDREAGAEVVETVCLWERRGNGW